MKHSSENRPRNPTSTLLTGVLLVALEVGVVAAATEVNTCGQTFSGSGFLSADLDCTGFAGDAVVIDGGTLDLRGLILTGGMEHGVTCARNCKVISDPPGGTIRDAALNAIQFQDLTPFSVAIKVQGVLMDGNGGGVEANTRATLVDCTLSNDEGGDAVDASFAIKLLRTNITNTTGRLIADRVRVIDSVLTGCGTTEDCLEGERVTVRNSTVSGAGEAGIGGRQITVIDSTITTNNGPGVSFSGGPERLKVVRSSITANGERGISGVSAGHVVIKDSDISGNALEGIFELDVISIDGSTITNNGRSGVSTGSTAMFSLCDVRITDSIFSGNGTDLAVCGVSETCADIATCGQAPDLQGSTTCETSYDTDSGFPGTSWSVCSLD